MDHKKRCNALQGRKSNKAGYMATLVACGWAGAVLEKVTRASGQEPYTKKLKNAKEVKMEPTSRPTNLPTNQPTNQPTN